MLFTPRMKNTGHAKEKQEKQKQQQQPQEGLALKASGLKYFDKYV